jgi:pseudouridine-5'-phosphate glycosidase
VSHAVIVLGAEVAQALSNHRPLVALETAVLTHGLPAPDNVDVVLAMAAAVRDAGAVPAVVGVLAGEPRVGLDETDLRRLATGPARKCSVRDLPGAIVVGSHGGTTVAATLWLAHRVGLRVMATGGIGGVHHGTLADVSTDLPVLASVPMLVVCSGAKSVLDLPRTVELLETLGVAIVGYGTDRLPAFYWADSGLPVSARVDSPTEAAALARARDGLGLPQALLVTVPVPPAFALDPAEGAAWVAQATAEAAASATAGQAVTPTLLGRVAELSAGRSLAANRALLVNNARVAAEVALALADGGWELGGPS